MPLWPDAPLSNPLFLSYLEIMAKKMITSLLLFFLYPCALFPGRMFYIGADAMMMDGFFSPGQRISMEASIEIFDVRISVPFSYAFDLDEDMAFVDAGIRLDCYPFDGLGLFFGADLVRYGRFFGRASPDNKDVLLSSLVIGYTFLFPYSYLEPRIILMDPGRLVEEVTSVLRNSFYMYSNFYFALIVGVSF